MRFREQQIILEKSSKIINNTVSTVSSLLEVHSPSGERIPIVKLDTKILEALDDLKKLKYFDKNITKLQDLGLKRENIIGETIRVKNSTIINRHLTSLENKIKIIIESISFSLPKERRNSLVIGLKRDLIDFEEIIKVQKDIHKTLSMILSTNGEVDNKIDVSNFDSGSLWVEIFFGSALALKYISDIIAVIYKAKALSKQDKLFERRLEELDFQESIKHEFKEKISNAFDHDLKRQLEEYSSNIENGVNTDPEMFSKLFRATKELFDLIEAGNTFEITEKSLSEGIKQIPKDGEMIEGLKKLEQDQDTLDE